MKKEYAVQIIWSPEDAAYLAIPAELNGCIADGKTPEDGRPIPEPMNVEDMARLQQQAKINLQKHIEAEVKKAVTAVLQQLMQAQQPSPAWSYRGGMVFDPSENLLPSGGR